MTSYECFLTLKRYIINHSDWSVVVSWKPVWQCCRWQCPINSASKKTRPEAISEKNWKHQNNWHEIWLPPVPCAYQMFQFHWKSSKANLLDALKVWKNFWFLSVEFWREFFEKSQNFQIILDTLLTGKTCIYLSCL